MRSERRLYPVLACAAGLFWGCSSDNYTSGEQSAEGGLSDDGSESNGHDAGGRSEQAGSDGPGPARVDNGSGGSGQAGGGASAPVDNGSGGSGQVGGSASVPVDNGSGGSSQAGGAAPTRLDGGLFSDPFVDCVALTETAANTRGPADVLIAIDNTPSMYNEIEELRANMNRFSEMVGRGGLDLHIVLISCFTEQCLRQRNWHTICIDPPLGVAGACSELGNLDDSNLPGFLHVDETVESRKALQSIADTSPLWSAMIRDDAAKHVVVVSDDGDDWTAEQFTTALTDREPRFRDYQFHGIFSYLSKEAACDISSSEPCCTYAAPGGDGITYRELVRARGGVSGDLCLQDFDPVFDELAGQVIASARLNCEWEIPNPPQTQQTLDARLVNVEYTDGSGQRFLIGRVSGSDDCNQVQHAWYYDDASRPTTIHVCHQTCDWIQGQIGAEINIQFGCESVWAPIE